MVDFLVFLPTIVQKKEKFRLGSIPLTLIFFRLWPNGTEVSRYIENDITLSTYTIPSGTHVDLNPSVHFRNPDHFPEPDKHIPERWLRKDEASEFKDLDLDLDKINKLIDAAEKVRICKI